MIALIFPGQGSQYLGMGKDFFTNYSEIQTLFSQAEKLTRVPIFKLCFEGPLEELTKTINLHACLTCVNISCFEVFKKHLGDNFSKVKFVAGHSLGEFSALYAASVLSLEDTFLAVRERGKCLEEIAISKPSGMYAIINFPLKELEEIVSTSPGVVVISNYNSPKQLVISGEEPFLSEIAEKLKEKGAKVVKLKVSAGFHSPLMKEAQERFLSFLSKLTWQDPRISFVSSVTGKAEALGSEIRAIMERQIVSPVKWISAVEYMYDKGVRFFVEIGPKRVLSGLVSQILDHRDIKVLNVEDETTLQETIKVLEGLT